MTDVRSALEKSLRIRIDKEIGIRDLCHLLSRYLPTKPFATLSEDKSDSLSEKISEDRFSSFSFPVKKFTLHKNVGSKRTFGIRNFYFRLIWHIYHCLFYFFVNLGSSVNAVPAAHLVVAWLRRASGQHESRNMVIMS